MVSLREGFRQEEIRGPFGGRWRFGGGSGVLKPSVGVRPAGVLWGSASQGLLKVGVSAAIDKIASRKFGSIKNAYGAFDIFSSLPCPIFLNQERFSN